MFIGINMGVVGILSGGASILALFAAGEQGAWYDSSDFSTLFQDSAGTTPVTAVEQPVGKMLDKSGRGNHATQSTSASRPTLSARYNLLTATASLATQSVTVTAGNYTLRFEGAGTITLTGAAIGVYTAGSYTVTTTAASLTLTVIGTVTNADFRAANDGVGLPVYQRVNTSTDYDTVGFPPYLKFDGVDDGMVTGTITPNIDKVQVFAGVRKLSDVLQGIIAEFSANLNNNAGSFFFLSGTGLVPGPNYSSESRGSAPASSNQAAISASSFVAPITNVTTSTHDISGDLSTLRANGAATGSNGTGDQGNGNYLAYPLYIGRRGGASLPFNGRLYSLIVRFGANLTNVQITSTEAYVNSKTEAY